MKSLSTWLTLLLTGLASSTGYSADSVAELFDDVRDSVVVIETKEKSFREGGWTRRVSVEGLGTGVIVSKEGDILTAAHVVHTADSVVVHTADGEKYSATVRGSNVTADVARLTLNYPPEQLSIARLADSDEVDIGDPVFVVGAPYGLEHTLTVGHVSGRRFDEQPFYANLEYLQTDAAINQGNSGGPMFNANGQVVGIVSYIISQSGGFEGLGFATTSNVAYELMFEQPLWWSGMNAIPVQSRLARAINLPQPFGLLVQRVADRSIGHSLGLKPGDLPANIAGIDLLLGGDVILAIAGVEITGDGSAFKRMQAAADRIPTGGRFEVDVWRSGERVTLFTTKRWE